MKLDISCADTKEFHIDNKECNEIIIYEYIIKKNINKKSFDIFIDALKYNNIYLVDKYLDLFFDDYFNDELMNYISLLIREHYENFNFLYDEKLLNKKNINNKCIMSIIENKECLYSECLSDSKYLTSNIYYKRKNCKYINCSVDIKQGKDKIKLLENICDRFDSKKQNIPFILSPDVIFIIILIILIYFYVLSKYY